MSVPSDSPPAPRGPSAGEFARLKEEVSDLAEAVRALAAGVGELRAMFDEREADWAAGFKTNDLVWIHGRTLFVNGVGPITLDQKESVLLRILAGLSRSSSAGHRGFVQTETILDVIEKNFPKEWSMPCSREVHKVVSSLRGKLHAKHLNKFLIESSSGAGYRLSTPARCIRVGRDC